METFDLIPVRCYTCNSVIGRHQGIYEELLRDGLLPGEIMDRLGVKRGCCRMNMLSPSKIIHQSSERPTGSIAVSRGDIKLNREVDILLSTVRSLDITEVPTLESTGVTESMSSEGTIEFGPLSNTRSFSTGVATQISHWNMPQTGLEGSQAPNNMGMTQHEYMDPNKQFNVTQVRRAVQVSQQLQPKPQLQVSQLQPQNTLPPIRSLPSQINTTPPQSMLELPRVEDVVTPQQGSIGASTVALIPVTTVESDTGGIEAALTLESLGI